MNVGAVIGIGLIVYAVAVTVLLVLSIRATVSLRRLRQREIGYNDTICVCGHGVNFHFIRSYDENSACNRLVCRCVQFVNTSGVPLLKRDDDA